MMNCCNSYHTNGRITRVTTIKTTMAAHSNGRVAAIALSVLYRMLTVICCWEISSCEQLLAITITSKKNDNKCFFILAV